MDPHRRERAVLLGLGMKKPGGAEELEARLEELKHLAFSAGAKVVARFSQLKRAPDPAMVVGKGKAREVAEWSHQHRADVVIFSGDLTPLQQRNLEAALEMPVVDRTQLILDIFAQRARSREGKIQVELAQMLYYLPRLTGKGVEMSRLGGTIGTRGPGETKLETDRRHIRRRIQVLRRELDQVRQQREVQRQRRHESTLPTVALVGYTNAGKSTLLNALSGADAAVADRLFATLDPQTRRVELPHGHRALVTDTVGFIQDLPEHLLEAFRATLEEAEEADLLLEVLDASHPQMEAQHEAVIQVLQELGLERYPRLVVLNKIDLVPPGNEREQLQRHFPGSVQVSAQASEGLEQLVQDIARLTAGWRRRVRLQVPYSAGDVRSLVHEQGREVVEEFGPEGVVLEVELDSVTLARVESYIVRGDD